VGPTKMIPMSNVEQSKFTHKRVTVTVSTRPVTPETEMTEGYGVARPGPSVLMVVELVNEDDAASRQDVEIKANNQRRKTRQRALRLGFLGAVRCLVAREASLRIGIEGGFHPDAANDRTSVVVSFLIVLPFCRGAIRHGLLY
jgi:hypothetical protein